MPAPNLPTRLDPQLISRATLKGFSLANWQNLEISKTAAELAGHRQPELGTPTQPAATTDASRCAEPGEAHCRRPAGRAAQPFGSLPIQHQLTLDQLAELLELRPNLLNQVSFVNIWLTKLRPDADADWRHDPAEMRAYLDRLLAFVRRLNASHNSLKAHVIYQILVLDRSQGRYDKALFLEYLKLPRRPAILPWVKTEQEGTRPYPVDLNADFTSVTLLPIIRDDEPLVRSYLLALLRRRPTRRRSSSRISTTFTSAHLFAETKIALRPGRSGAVGVAVAAGTVPAVQGTGRYRLRLHQQDQLRGRRAGEARTARQERADADREGLRDQHANYLPRAPARGEHRHQSRRPGGQRGAVADVHRAAAAARGQQFEFPQLTKPGVYVIDFIGNGKSSRALVRKGRLRPLVATSTAGQIVHVVDDANRAGQWTPALAGRAGISRRRRRRDRRAVQHQPGRGSRSCSASGDFSCLDYLDHQAEAYRLRRAFTSIAKRCCRSG